MPTGHCPVPVLPRSAKTSFPGRKDHFATLRGPSRLKPKRSLGRFRPRQRQPFRPCGWSLPGFVAISCVLASTGRSPCRWRCRWRCSAVCCGRWRCAAACRYRPGVHWRVRWLFYSPPARLRQHTREGQRPGNRSNGSPHPSKKRKKTEEVCTDPLPPLPVVPLPPGLTGMAH